MDVSVRFSHTHTLSLSYSALVTVAEARFVGMVMVMHK